MSENEKHKMVDIIQWILIIVLSVYCVYLGRENKKMNEYYEIKKENTYLKIYDSQAIEELKNQNKQLYDSIKKLNDVESVVNVEYVYKYISDTVFVNDTSVAITDSVYHYANLTDSINYELDIKATDLKWHKLDLSINDNFMLVTREHDNKVETSVSTKYGSIEDGIMWHRKNKSLKDRIVIGPSVGIGFGTLNKKFDIFLGGSVTLDLW